MDIHIRSFILEVLYPVFLFFFLILLRLLRGVNKIFCSSKKQVCIYPPAGAGSVGDEAMMEALIASFNAEDVKNITILTIEDGNPWDLKRVDHYYKLSNRYIPLRIIYFSWIIHKYDEFYLLGADMMDGYYSASGSINRIRLANIAAKIGLSSSILGFSFNNSPDKGVVDYFNKCDLKVKVCLRDPISYGRFINTINTPANLVADMAFMLKPDSRSEYTDDLLKKIMQVKNKKMIIGLNASYHSFEPAIGKGSRSNSQIIIDLYTKVMAEVLTLYPNVFFVLLPHDYRTKEFGEGDHQLAESIFNHLPKDVKEEGKKDDNVVDADFEEVKDENKEKSA